MPPTESDPADEAQAGDPTLDWVLPGYRAAPAEAMHRIQGLCQGIPDLFTAMLTVLLTHGGVPRELLAVAIKQCRSDLDTVSREDVGALLVAAYNGGKSGFDAIWRARVQGHKKGDLSWVKE